jgi:hypothetical protein
MACIVCGKTIIKTRLGRRFCGKVCNDTHHGRRKVPGSA